MDAQNLFESLKADITCLICLGYLNEPVIVKCGHTFCEMCLFSCWKDAETLVTCPKCKAIIKFGDFSDNWKLQNLAISGKMLGPYLFQSIKGLTTCEKHGKEENFFCEDDHRPLCGPCFLTTDHKEHKVLPVETAALQCMEKLWVKWDIFDQKKQEFQMKLECEEKREEQWKAESQTLKKMVTYEYEKMHQFFVEKEQLQLQRLDEEARNKDSRSQEILNPQMNSEKKPMEMLKSEIEIMKLSVKSEFEKKHQFLSEEKQRHLQRLDQEMKDNQAGFEKNKEKMTQQIHELQEVISETEKCFEKLPTEMLMDATGILERNEELLLQNLVVTSGEWTMCPIPGIKEMLLNFYMDITLDPETANPHLILSNDLKSVKQVSVPQDVPNNPEGFDFALRVLATQSFTSGKHYWEVEVENKSGWEVGFCQESIKRNGKVHNLAGDTYTLVAYRSEYDCCLFYSDHNINLSQPIHKVGVFLDYESGHIAFYNATDGTLIYSPPNVVFQGPLYPCFSPCFPSWKNTSGTLHICPRSN